MMLLALVIGSAQANQLDDLIDASTSIKTQLDTATLLVGAATSYAHTAEGMSDGTLSQSAHITSEQISAYNEALVNMASYQPYGDLSSVLENKAQHELELMDEAITVFSTAVVEMASVVEISEMATSAETPQQQEQVQEYVVANAEVLQVSQDTVNEFNQSVDDIESHANSAVAYLSIAGSDEAMSFFEQSIENANTTAEQTSIFYDANAQWVAMGYPTTRNLSAVMLNGQDGIGLDMYVTEADVLLVGADSEYYLNGLTALGYDCFMTQECE
jgi:hypothetical protein